MSRALEPLPFLQSDLKHATRGRCWCRVGIGVAWRPFQKLVDGTGQTAVNRAARAVNLYYDMQRQQCTQSEREFMQKLFADDPLL